MKNSEIRRLIRNSYRIKEKKGRFYCAPCGDELTDLASCCNADEIFNIYLLGDVPCRASK